MKVTISYNKITAFAAGGFAWAAVIELATNGPTPFFLINALAAAIGAALAITEI